MSCNGRRYGGERGKEEGKRSSEREGERERRERFERGITSDFSFIRKGN